MYRHQVIISLHTLSSTNDRAAYEDKADELKELIMEKLDEINSGVSGGEEEQLFHKVYSNAVSYFQNADNVFNLSNDGNTATAQYYINSTMSEFISNINDNADLMNSHIDDEMKATRDKMDTSITTVDISVIVCSLAIVTAVTVCLIMCVRITAKCLPFRKVP